MSSFLKTLFYGEVLGSEQNWEKGTEIFHIPPALTDTQPRHCHRPPAGWHICYSWWTCADTSLSHQVLGLREGSLSVHSVDWDKWIMACITEWEHLLLILECFWLHQSLVSLFPSQGSVSVSAHRQGCCCNLPLCGEGTALLFPEKVLWYKKHLCVPWSNTFSLLLTLLF